jgi:phosphoenolpyruvate carboxykinase (GTP)
MPLVLEAFNWNHGVYLGATMSSEKTAAAAGTVGELRHDPFAMLPFCGYNMGDYFAHWVKVGKEHDESKLPKIFCVNWFRKDQDGKFLWPGFGENSRVLEWVFRRTDGDAEAVETAIGMVPAKGAIDIDGVDVSDAQMEQLLTVDDELVKEELPAQHQHLARFGGNLPKELENELAALEQRLGVTRD